MQFASHFPLKQIHACTLNLNNTHTSTHCIPYIKSHGNTTNKMCPHQPRRRNAARDHTHTPQVHKPPVCKSASRPRKTIATGARNSAKRHYKRRRSSDTSTHLRLYHCQGNKSCALIQRRRSTQEKSVTNIRDLSDIKCCHSIPEAHSTNIDARSPTSR